MEYKNSYRLFASPKFSPPYLLSVDVGTESIRSGIFDSQGNNVALAKIPCSTHFLGNGKVEQNPNEIWQALKKSITCCLNKISPHSIMGIGIDTTSVTLVAVDRKGNPLRPAILWMDNRAVKEAEIINSTHHPVLMYSGGKISPEWMIPKILWLKKHQPAIYKKSYRIVELMDWLVYKLTGQWAVSLCNISCEWNYLSRERKWPKDLLEYLGLEDVLSKWPTRIYRMGETIGKIAPSMASELGLNPKTVVVGSGIDGYAAAIGANVLKEGYLAYTLGSCSCYITLSSKPKFIPGFWGPIYEAIVPNKWALEGGQTSAGSVLKWFRDNLLPGNLKNKRENKNLFLMDKRAEEIPPGSNGLIVLDCWQGNRTPYLDPIMRGAIVGLSLNHTKEDIYRAILEGIAYGGYNVFRMLKKAGLKIDKVCACGGGAKSEIWMQIHADVFGIPFLLTTQPDASLLGTAICIAKGIGVYHSLLEATDKMVHIAKVIDPDPSNHRIYKEYFYRYLKLYESLAALVHNKFENRVNHNFKKITGYGTLKLDKN